MGKTQISSLIMYILKGKTASGTSLQRPDVTKEKYAIEKCNILNIQYKNIFTLEDSSLPKMENCNNPTMPSVNITSSGIVKQLQNVNPKKRHFSSNNECCSEVVPYLRIIFQQSIDMEEEPKDWKHARIRAIFKKDKKDIAANLEWFRWRLHHAIHINKENQLKNTVLVCRIFNLYHNITTRQR